MQRLSTLVPWGRVLQPTETPPHVSVHPDLYDSNSQSPSAPCRTARSRSCSDEAPQSDSVHQDSSPPQIDAEAPGPSMSRQ